MAKPELGTKRQCLSCGAKFYDLNRDPILCPKCGAPFQVTVQHALAARAEESDDEAETENDAVDIVSLDDVAAQEDSAETTSDEDIDLGEDIPDDDEEAFLADEDEENDDVSDLIDGDIDGDDEN